MRWTVMDITATFLIFLLVQASHGKIRDQFPSHITVGALEPPLINGTGFVFNYYSYMQQDILQWLREPLNFNYTVESSPDLRFGGFNNGSWDGVIGQLVRREIDVGAAAFSITYARSLVIDYSTPIFLDVTGLLIPFPEEDSKALASIQPYPASVWFCIIFSLLLVGFAFWAEPRLSAGMKSRLPVLPNFGQRTLFMLSILVGQGNYMADDRYRIRMMLGVWSLACVVLLNVYNGMLISILTVPSYTPVVNSIEDVAASSRVKFTTIRSTAVNATVLASDSGAFKTIGDSIRREPGILIDNDEQGVQMVLTGRYAYAAERKQLEYIIQNDVQKHKTCQMTLAKKDFLERKIGFALVKNSPLKPALDHQILLMQQFGFMSYWQNRYLTRKDACIIKNRKISGKNQPLSLSQLMSVFFIWFFGLGISLLTFIVEFAIGRT